MGKIRRWLHSRGVHQFCRRVPMGIPIAFYQATGDQIGDEIHL